MAIFNVALTIILPLCVTIRGQFLVWIFVIVLVLIILALLGRSKQNIYCVFTELLDECQDNSVGGILYTKSIRSP